MQKTAYEMRISDWSSDVCSSDLPQPQGKTPAAGAMERFGIGEPAEQSGRFMFRGAAEIGEQRRAQQRPPEAVDSYPIAVQRKLQPPVGTKIGVRPPCDIGKQTGGVAKAGQLRRDRTSTRLNPSH